MIESLKQMWPGLNIQVVHGKPRHSQSQGSVERANQDIENMVFTIMSDHNSTAWSSAYVRIGCGKYGKKEEERNMWKI